MSFPSLRLIIIFSAVFLSLSGSFRCHSNCILAPHWALLLLFPFCGYCALYDYYIWIWSESSDCLAILYVAHHCRSAPWYIQIANNDKIRMTIKPTTIITCVLKLITTFNNNQATKCMYECTEPTKNSNA